MRVGNLIRLIVLLFLAESVSLEAQQLISAYSVDQGLPQSTVTALYRDNEGYLWCGTGSGLALYDGWEFYTPKKAQGKGNSAINSTVRGICPSTDQTTVWVGSESVVSQYDRFSYRILRSFDIIKEPGIAEVPFFANDTAVWLMGWAHGLYRVRIEDGKLTRLTSTSFVDNSGYSPETQVVIFPDSTGQLVAYNIFTNTVKRIQRPAEMQNCTFSSFEPLPGGAGSFLAVTSHGLWEVNVGAGTIKRYSLGDAAYDDTKMDIRALDVHPDGSWWLGVMDVGVFRYDPVHRKLRPCLWQRDGSYAGSLLKSPKSIVCDEYGVVWLGTDGAGVIKLLHNRITFRDKFTDPVITDTCRWFIRCFYEMSTSKYLVGTFRGGLQLVDHDANKITRVTIGSMWEGTTPTFITGSGEGRLLVGTDQSLLLLDTNTWVTEAVILNNVAIDPRYTGYLRLQSGDIFVYGNQGIQRLETSGRPQLSPYLGKLANITSAVQLEDGRIVAASYYAGMQVLTPTGTLVKEYDYEKHVGIPVTSNIRGMHVDENGNLLLGSESGLHCLNNEFRLIRTLTTENGISDNTIYAIAAIDKHSIVLATGHGITVYNTTTRNCEIYSGVDGLPSEECNSGALLWSSSAQLYIGTISGFVRWNPFQSSTCFRPSRILASYGDSNDNDTGIVRESIVRDYGAGSIDLKIWITDFAFPERVELTHQLKGSNEDRVTLTGKRSVNYAALSSGFYSFVCSAKVPGCQSTELSKLFTIKIVPPFWMSGWFIGLTGMGVVLLITVVLFVIMRLRYQRKIRKFKMQQELDKIRQRISRDIHDEIGAGLTRIALSGDLMSQKFVTNDPTYDKLKWIAGTARELSQNMKEVVWSVNPHYDSLDHMAAYFRSYVSGVAENADVRFVFEADDRFPTLPVNPETRRNLLLILKEAVSNSVKYAKATELKLALKWKNAQFTMEISDNGKGFDLKDQAGVNSNGLRNIKQRAEASRCKVSINSVPGNGTTTIVSGPISE